jgi:cell division protein FtsB
MKPNDVKDIKSNDSLELNESSLSNDERKEFEQLKERNKQLEMENDLLKKLRALVQQRTQQEKKKK